MYKLHKFSFSEATFVIRQNTDGSTTCIPFDPANTDYQEFLAWKAEGNEPLPADDNG